ncbi:hypothetical protein DV515_00013489 [Chloebia gouldiae]|uniref:Uncharacterized protein n=1 Tax=Chloebia gouldiae TaxID=44316 RepID=A0A3L8S176_CHLGU|nr:hypothetical protein DV515_00013489 [Chloebia gouldiae]
MSGRKPAKEDVASSNKRGEKTTPNKEKLAWLSSDGWSSGAGVTAAFIFSQVMDAGCRPAQCRVSSALHLGWTRATEIRASFQVLDESLCSSTTARGKESPERTLDESCVLLTRN